MAGEKEGVDLGVTEEVVDLVEEGVETEEVEEEIGVEEEGLEAGEDSKHCELVLVLRSFVLVLTRLC